ncbi:MAG: hypothetical protein KBB01_00490 [Candidatus Omnitrophica bacterium]|nr:hypothetical protein [Candidatus Omnitrophota bacterium]
MISINRKANAILEYGVVIAIIIGVMLAMQPFIRRGTQAKVKDLSDAFIGYYPNMAGNNADGSRVKEHKQIDTLASDKFENEGGNTLTITTDDDAWYNYDIPVGSEAGSVRDVVDYAVKPPAILYPDTQYIEWNLQWDLVSVN